MNKKIHDIFNQIYAEEDLKKNTADLLYEEIQNRRAVKRMGRLRIASVLAAFVFILFAGSFSYGLYFTPSAYVDLDVNPSIELTLNRFDRVIAVSSYNDDGDNILSMINVRYATYTKAVNKLLDIIAAQGYLTQDGLISLTLQTENINKESDMLNELNIMVNSVLQAHHSSAAADIFSVSEEVKSCAHENQISPAKYIAIVELQQVDETASFDSCMGHSISEIRQRTQDCSENHHNESFTDEDNTVEDNSSGNYESEGNHYGNHGNHH